MAFVAELYDSRLTADEKVLLWQIRYRAGINGFTWSSWKTFRKETGITKPTLMRRIKKLKDLGFLTSKKRGYGMSDNKSVASPVDIYPVDLLDTHEIGKLFSANRTEEDLATLRSLDLDNAGNSSGLTDETTDDLDDGNNVQWSHQRDHDGLTSDTSLVSPVRPKLDTKSDKGELDLSRFASQGEPPQSAPHGGIQYTDDGEAFDPRTGELLGETRDDRKGKGDSRSAADIAALAASVGAQTAEKEKASLAKRAENKALREASGEAERIREWKEKTKSERQTEASKLFDFAEEVFGNHFPRARFGKWSKQQYSQAIKLFEFYDYDVEMVREAWRYTCENWDELKRKVKVTDKHPTIGWLLGFRERVFPEIQEVMTKREDAEADQLESDIGW